MSYDHFQRCRAVRGHGPERKMLLEELKLEETMRCHFIIQTVAGISYRTGKPYAVDEALKTRRQVCEDRIVAICARLTDITTPLANRLSNDSL